MDTSLVAPVPKKAYVGVPIKANKRIKVYVSPQAWADMFEHTDSVECEIGGVFVVRVTSRGLYVDSVAMLTQRAATDELHLSTDPGELMFWQMERGWCDGKTQYANWGQWHSHYLGSVGRSAEDEENIREAVTHGWYVTIILNQHRKVHCSVDTLIGDKDPKLALHITFEGDLELDAPVTVERKETLEKERKEKFTEYTKRVPSVSVHGGYVGTSMPSAHMPSAHMKPYPGHLYGTHGTYGTRTPNEPNEPNEHDGKGEPWYGWTMGNGEHIQCIKCKRVWPLCVCQGPSNVTIEVDGKLEWPRKGRLVKRIKECGYTVKFHYDGMVSINVHALRKVIRRVAADSKVRVFLEAIGFKDRVFNVHHKSGHTVLVGPGADTYEVEYVVTEGPDYGAGY